MDNSISAGSLCDLCHSNHRTAIPEIPGSVICDNCGFVYVPERRSSEEIAAAWDDLWSEAYTSQWPGVISRLTYVAEFCDQTFGWTGKTVLDIGAGEGTFLKMVASRGARPEGLEPSAENCEKINDLGFWYHHETIASIEARPCFDAITLNWTLENTGDCMAVLRKARELLKPGGLIVVATGSRILVPFKKPFSSYVSDLPPDLHCYRWSAVSICRALCAAGFGDFVMNDYQQNDAMIIVSKRYEVSAPEYPDRDDPQAVLRYFRSWKEQFP